MDMTPSACSDASGLRSAGRSATWLCSSFSGMVADADSSWGRASSVSMVSFSWGCLSCSDPVSYSASFSCFVIGSCTFSWPRISSVVGSTRCNSCVAFSGKASSIACIGVHVRTHPFQWRELVDHRWISQGGSWSPLSWRMRLLEATSSTTCEWGPCTDAHEGFLMYH